MKVLIWISCFFAATILNAILGYLTGIKAGVVVVYLIVYFVAKKLCDNWDEYKYNKNAKTGLNSETIVVNGEKIKFCRKCGEELMNYSNFCRKCGTEMKL